MTSLGIDVGSVAVHLALLDPEGRVLWRRSRAQGGKVAATLTALLQALIDERGDQDVRVGLTASARPLVGPDWPAVTSTSEVVAAARGAARLCDDALAVIEIGGHLSRWMALTGPGGDLTDFAVSGLCAAGAGAFLEQQAGRLDLTVQQLAAQAAASRHGASVAGRCSVFAKSDMIHLQQKGTPVEEIAYGLCLALIRNFGATVLRGRVLTPPVAVVGGGALNGGLVRALKQVFDLADADLRIPDLPQSVAAVGAAMAADEDDVILLSHIRDLVGRGVGRSTITHLERLPDPGVEPPMPEPDGAGIGDDPVYLGVDVGSVSTNLALLDGDGEVVDACYLRTRGRPLLALQEGLDRLHAHHGDGLDVVGVGTTGSGRHLAAWFLGGDVVHNEITAQLRSSVAYLPEVETVLEIGGQDSKYIHARGGHIVDFTMNKICAAGTGSFIEEQAERLGISIIDEFAALALSAEQPVDLGTRCTVFMDSELVHALRAGAGIEDITAGLALSVAQNYLDRVVAGRPIGEHVLFQGGTASNRAVVAAFRQILGRPVRVHPYNRVSGAVGVGLLARDARKEGRLDSASSFRGVRGCRGALDRSFECTQCTNRCQVNRFKDGDEVFFFGDTCERFTSRAGRGGRALPEGPLSRLDELVLGGGQVGDETVDPERAIGIPRASLSYPLLPLYASLARAAGREPVLSKPSSTAIASEGLRRLAAETCLPVKMVYGHVQELLDRGVRTIMLPAVLSMPGRPGEHERSETCPYTQHLPYMVRTTMDAHLIAPQLRLEAPPDQRVVHPEVLARSLGISVERLDQAVQEGLDAMAVVRQQMRELGDGVLTSDAERILVVLGKPYNVHDTFLNLGLGRHLQRLGLPHLAMECLPLDEVELGERWLDLPWGINRDYVRVAHLIQDDPRLFPVVLSSFGCGPDGFAVKHVDALLEGRPRLLLELDEHRAEAGLITRLEAFSDEIDGYLRTGSLDRGHTIDEERVAREPGAVDRLFLPHVADHVWAYAGALRRVGREAVILPKPDDASRKLGEEVASGRECHPFSMVAGDLLKLLRDREVGERDAFYYPGGLNPCLIPQYRDSMLLAMQRLGGRRMQVVTPLMDDMLSTFGVRGLLAMWEGLVATDLLTEGLCRVRPYEAEEGATDRLHQRSLRVLADAVERGEVRDALTGIARELSAIPVDRTLDRPRIGVAGDVYTRVNDFACDDLWRRLEDMGCEVMPPPMFTDVADYNVSRRIGWALRDRWLSEALRWRGYELLKDRSTEKLREVFADVVPPRRPIGYFEATEAARRYVGRESNNLLVLNLAEMIDFARRGAHGLINAMCFNCMIGTTSAAIMERMRRDLEGIPMTSLTYGGTGGSTPTARLEAFTWQVHRYFERGSTSSTKRSISP